MPEHESRKAPASQYEILVAAFYQAILKPEEDIFLKDALTLAFNFDEETVEQAKREASVMVAVDSQFHA
jgi:hypothetical protein